MRRSDAVKNLLPLPPPGTDAYVAVLDRITDAVLDLAAPYITSEQQAGMFAADIQQSLETHLAAELRYVATGRGDACNGTRAIALRHARRAARSQTR